MSIVELKLAREEFKNEHHDSVAEQSTKLVYSFEKQYYPLITSYST